MSRPTFTAALIGELRCRVIAHNEASDSKVKLGDLKRIYGQGYRGARPGAAAMRKVDEHLEGLAKGFNPDEARSQDGRFSSGGVKRAASVAAEGVKRAAHHAAYQAGLASEPLKAGVKVPKRAPLNMPGDRDVHRTLQAQNAGYAALTSSVVPERRYELAGGIARNVIAGAGGLAMAHMLLTDNPKSRFRRGVVKGAAWPLGVAAKVAVGVPLHAGAWAAEGLNGRVGLPEDPGAVKRMAYELSSKADKKVQQAARVAADKFIGGAGLAARRFVDVVEGAPIKAFDESFPAGIKANREGMKELAGYAGRYLVNRSSRAVRRGGALAAVAAVPTIAIGRAIAASPADPVAIGQAWDQYSYRTIQKALAMPETEELRKDMTAALRKAAAMEGLESGVERLFQRGSRVALTSLSSLAGSAIGAASGASAQAVSNVIGQKGNPYHDAHGRFTSKQDSVNGSGIGRAALAGASIGAAIGGGAAHLRLTAVNRRYFRGAMQALDEHMGRLTRDVNAPPLGGKHFLSEVEDLHRAKARELHEHNAGGRKFVKDAEEFAPEMMAYKQGKKELGDAEPMYYRHAVKDIVEKRLADVLKGFKVGSPESVAKATPEKFRDAIKDLVPEQKTAAINLYEMRDTAPRAVDDALASVRGKLGAAQQDLDEKDTALAAASDHVEAAKGRLEAIPAEGAARDAASKELTDAETALTKATLARSKSHKALQALQMKGLQVPHPFKPGEMIGKPSEMERGAFEAELRAPIRESAAEAHGAAGAKIAAKYNAKITKAKNRYLAQLRIEHGAKIASFVAMGRRSGALEGVTGKAVEPLLKAHADMAASEAAFHAAEGRVGALAGQIDAETEAMKTLKGPAKEEKSALITKLKADAAGAKAERDAADVAFSTARAAVADEAEKYHAAYRDFLAKSLSKPSRNTLTPQIRAQILADIKRAASDTYDPISQYAIQPTAAGLRAVMKHVGAPLGRVTRDAAQGVKRIAQEAAGTVDGNGNWNPSATKMAFLVGTGALAGAAETLHATGQYIRARASGDKTAKAPTNFKVEMVRSPFKDEGMMLVHAAHPTQKNERVVLLGERLDGGKATFINPGAKLSDVMAQFHSRQNQGGGNGGGAQPPQLADAGWLGNDKQAVDEALKKIRGGHTETLNGPGGAVEVRKQDDGEAAHNEASNKFMQAYRNKFLNGATHKDPGAYYGALAGLFSRQSAVLKRGQMFQALTGFTPKGDKKGNGVFPADEDFGGDADEAKGALEQEISRIVKRAAPRDEAQRNLLRRAVTVIGRSKGISDDNLKSIYAKIDADEKASAPTQHATREVEAPTIELPKEAPRNQPADYASHAEKAAANLSREMNIDDPAEEDALAETIAKFSGALASTRGYSVPVATMIVARAIKSAGMPGPDSSPSDFTKLLSVEAARYERDRRNDRAEKVAFAVDGPALDNLEVLAKRLPSMVPALPSDQGTTPSRIGSPRPTEAAPTGAVHASAAPRLTPHVNTSRGIFRQDGLYDAQSAARNFEPPEVRGLVRTGQKVVSGMRAPRAGAAPTYKPVVDIGSAAADFAAAGAANHLLDHVLPTPKIGENFKLSRPVSGAAGLVDDVKGLFTGGAASGVKNIAKLGVKGLAAGALGSALYNAVQGSAGGDQYRRATGPAENLTMGLGNFAGGMAGESLGGDIGAAAGDILGSAAGPVGTVAGGAVGAALGEALGHYGYQFFKGYDPQAVRRIMGSRLKPAPNQEAVAQAGEVGGGVIGNALGGARGEGLGGVIGSVVGVSSARAAAPVAPATKSRRE